MNIKRAFAFILLCLMVLSTSAGTMSFMTDEADVSSALTASWDYEKYIRTVIGLAVTTPPAKVSYVHGETFDPTGMVITASFDDPGPTRDVAGGSVTVSPATLSYDTTNVTVGYEGATTSVPVTVDRINVGLPPSQSGSLTYTGAAQSPAWTAYDNTKMTPAAASSVNAGSYNATFSLAQPYYRWSDGSTAPKAVTWSIGKATPTASANKTSLSLTSSSPSGTVVVTTNSDGAVTATSANTGVATTSVSGKTVTVTGVSSGSTTVAISLAAGTNYSARSVATITVNASFVPAWASLANGSIVTMGTFSINGTVQAPVSKPWITRSQLQDSGAGDGSVSTFPVNDGLLPAYRSATYAFGNSSSTASNNLKWIKMTDSLLICDRCILGNLSVNDLVRVIGAESVDALQRTVTIDGNRYILRLPTPAEMSQTQTVTGYPHGQGGTILYSYPYDDPYFVDDLKIRTMAKSTAGYYAVGFNLRFGQYVTTGSWLTVDLTNSKSTRNAQYGFRPALELVG